eukprot:360221_1
MVACDGKHDRKCKPKRKPLTEAQSIMMIHDAGKMHINNNITTYTNEPHRPFIECHVNGLFSCFSCECTLKQLEQINPSANRTIYIHSVHCAEQDKTDPNESQDHHQNIEHPVWQPDEAQNIQ